MYFFVRARLALFGALSLLIFYMPIRSVYGPGLRTISPWDARAFGALGRTPSNILFCLQFRLGINTGLRYLCVFGSMVVLKATASLLRCCAAAALRAPTCHINLGYTVFEGPLSRRGGDVKCLKIKKAPVVFFFQINNNTGLFLLQTKFVI